MNQLQAHLEQLETSLLAKEVRADACRLAELLAGDYLEFGVSGTVWTKQTVIAALLGETWSEWEISDFRLTLLAGDVALVTYRAHRHADGQRAAADSLRSSIWKLREARWQMVFHQGTAI